MGSSPGFVDPEGGLTPDVQGGPGTGIPATTQQRTAPDLFAAVDFVFTGSEFGYLMQFGGNNGLAIFVAQDGTIRWESRGSGGVWGTAIGTPACPVGAVTAYCGMELTEAGLWASVDGGPVTRLGVAAPITTNNGISGSASGQVAGFATPYPPLNGVDRVAYQGTLSDARVYFETPPPASLP